MYLVYYLPHSQKSITKRTLMWLGRKNRHGLSYPNFHAIAQDPPVQIYGRFVLLETQDIYSKIDQGRRWVI